VNGHSPFLIFLGVSIFNKCWNREAREVWRGASFLDRLVHVTNQIDATTQDNHDRNGPEQKNWHLNLSCVRPSTFEKLQILPLVPGWPCPIGTAENRSCLLPMMMTNVLEQSFNIAWGFLLRSGEIARPDATANFLIDSIRTQMRRGGHRPLMLSNRAIAAFQTKQ